MVSRNKSKKWHESVTCLDPIPVPRTNLVQKGVSFLADHDHAQVFNGGHRFEDSGNDDRYSMAMQFVGSSA